MNTRADAPDDWRRSQKQPRTNQRGQKREKMRHSSNFYEILRKFTRAAHKHIPLDDNLVTSGQRNLIRTAKHSRGVTRLYECSRAVAALGLSEEFKQKPRGGSRGAVTRIFPAVSPGRGSVVRGRLLVPVPACQLCPPCSRWSYG
jgi:hypothetical protein